MKHLHLVKIIVSWIRNYIVDYCIYMLIYVAFIATNKTYNFEYEGDTYKVKLNKQSLRTILYLYQENLEVCDAEKLDDDYMEVYRGRFLKKYGVNNLILDTPEGMLTISSHS